jgi:tellurite resistance protein TerC
MSRSSVLDEDIVMEGLMTTLVLWGGFGVLVVALLALDLGVFHRKAHVVTLKESLAWSAAWIAVALLFNLGIYFWRGAEPAMEFLTGYVHVKDLSGTESVPDSALPVLSAARR